MNRFKKFFENREVVSEHTEGMHKITKFSDGGTLITTNQEHGLVEGVHYTEYVEQVRQLKREKNHEEAIVLLYKLVDAVENESKVAGHRWGVAPWYYEQLAIIYRKEKRYADEVAILERYMKQTKVPGVGPHKLAERLSCAKELLRKNST